MASLLVRPLLPALLLGALALAGCGSEEIKVAQDSPEHDSAVIFQQRCSGCHSLDASGTQGSSSRINDREYKDGPNFNQRKEKADQVLYAIRNGGFSSGPMPQNIVTGREAVELAKYVDKYSGRQAAQAEGGGGNTGRAPNPGNPGPAGSSSSGG